MMNDYAENFVYDDPVTYKGLTFRPATMRDWTRFYSVAGILTIDKNSPPIATVEILGMSYLEYLFYAHTEEFPSLLFLRGVLSLLLNDATIDEKDRLSIDFAYRENGITTRAFVNGEGKVVTSSNKVPKEPVLLIDGMQYDKHDFKKIRNIIAGQNLLKIPNDKVDKRIRDAREEAKRLKAKMNGTKKQASLEDQMVALFVATGIPLNTIYSLTIRKFIKSLERLDNKIHYEIYLSASMSGLVQFKDKSFIKHWLSDLGSNDLDELISYDSIEAKVSGSNV